MRYPLIWKELRQSRLAVLVGLLWLIGPVEMWLRFKHITTPWPLRIVLVPAAMFASGACMLLLGVARFAYERHMGTWEFLQTRPVPLRRIVAAKWLVPLLLTVLFSSLSSGCAWFPLTRMGTHLAQFTLTKWVIMHACCSALFVTILLIIDTLDWGEWLGLRAVVSFLLIVPFMWMVQQEFNSQWVVLGAYAAGVATLTAGAIAAAPFITRESLLPVWRVGKAARAIERTPTRAWLWLQWRQVRFVFLLLLLPVPLFLAVICLPGVLAAASWHEQLDAVRGMMPVMNRVLPALLAISAGLLGWLVPLVDAQSKADSFRWVLPLPRTRMQHLRIAYAIGLVGLVFIPSILALVCQTLLLHDRTMLQLIGKLIIHFCMATGICVSMMLLSTFMISTQIRFVPQVVSAAGVMLMVYLADQFLGARSVNVMAMIAVGLAAIAAATALLPWIDRQREI